MTTTLGQLATDIRYGYTASAEREGTHRFVRITDIDDQGRLKASGARFVTPSKSDVDKFALAPGDLLFARSGSVGRPHLVSLQDDSVFASYLIRFRLDTQKIHPNFAFWFALSPQFKDQVSQLRRGGAIDNINAQQLAGIALSVPTMAEQRRIVARIKECMDRIDEIEHLALSAESEWSALGQSLVEDALASVGGDETVLGEVAKIGSELVDPTVPQFFDLPHVGGANIESKTGRLLEIKTAREEKLKSSKFTFSADMVLYNKIRPYLVKVARPTFAGLCSADMYPLLPVSTLSRDFLYYQLTSLHFTDYAISGSNRAGMPKVNREHLFAYRFKLPSIEEQVSVSEKLDNAMGALESARIVLREKANEVKAMRQSVLAMAFSGEM